MSEVLCKVDVRVVRDSMQFTEIAAKPHTKFPAEMLAEPYTTIRDGEFYCSTVGCQYVVGTVDTWRPSMTTCWLVLLIPDEDDLRSGFVFREIDPKEFDDGAGI